MRVEYVLLVLTGWSTGFITNILERRQMDNTRFTQSNRDGYSNLGESQMGTSSRKQRPSTSMKRRPSTSRDRTSSPSSKSRDSSSADLSKGTKKKKKSSSKSDELEDLSEEELKVMLKKVIAKLNKSSTKGGKKSTETATLKALEKKIIATLKKKAGKSSDKSSSKSPGKYQPKGKKEPSMEDTLMKLLEMGKKMMGPSGKGHGGGGKSSGGKNPGGGGKSSGKKSPGGGSKPPGKKNPGGGGSNSPGGDSSEGGPKPRSRRSPGGGGSMPPSGEKPKSDPKPPGGKSGGDPEGGPKPPGGESGGDLEGGPKPPSGGPKGGRKSSGEKSGDGPNSPSDSPKDGPKPPGSSPEGGPESGHKSSGGKSGGIPNQSGAMPGDDSMLPDEKTQKQGPKPPNDMGPMDGSKATPKNGSEDGFNRSNSDNPGRNSNPPRESNSMGPNSKPPSQNSSGGSSQPPNDNNPSEGTRPLGGNQNHQDNSRVPSGMDGNRERGRSDSSNPMMKDQSAGSHRPSNINDSDNMIGSDMNSQERDNNRSYRPSPLSRDTSAGNSRDEVTVGSSDITNNPSQLPSQGPQSSQDAQKMNPSDMSSRDTMVVNPSDGGMINSDQPMGGPISPSDIKPDNNRGSSDNRPGKEGGAIPPPTSKNMDDIIQNSKGTSQETLDNLVGSDTMKTGSGNDKMVGDNQPTPMVKNDNSPITSSNGGSMDTMKTDTSGTNRSPMDGPANPIYTTPGGAENPPMDGMVNQPETNRESAADLPTENPSAQGGAVTKDDAGTTLNTMVGSEGSLTTNNLDRQPINDQSSSPGSSDMTNTINSSGTNVQAGGTNGNLEATLDDMVNSKTSPPTTNQVYDNDNTLNAIVDSNKSLPTTNQAGNPTVISDSNLASSQPAGSPGATLDTLDSNRVDGGSFLGTNSLPNISQDTTTDTLNNLVGSQDPTTNKNNYIYSTYTVPSSRRNDYNPILSDNSHLTPSDSNQFNQPRLANEIGINEMQDTNSGSETKGIEELGTNLDTPPSDSTKIFGSSNIADKPTDSLFSDDNSSSTGLFGGESLEAGSSEDGPVL